MTPIRVLVGVLGMDQHEVGAVGIAKMLRDQGMEVIYTGCFNTPETIVQTAIEEDAMAQTGARLVGHASGASVSFFAISAERRFTNPLTQALMKHVSEPESEESAA